MQSTQSFRSDNVQRVDTLCCAKQNNGTAGSFSELP